MSQALQLDTGLPTAVDAERTILGAILLENQALSEVEERLTTDDFSLDSHRRIYQRMTELGREGRAVDLVTLAHELAKYKEIESVGGVAYLASLTEGLPRRPIIEEYIRIVKDKSLLRQLMLICSAAIARAADQSETAMDIALDFQSQIEERVAPSANADASPLQSFLVEVFDRINNDYLNKLTPCVTSGNDWFDAKAGGGYRKGKITLLAARPGVGKTAWAIMSAVANLQKGVGVDFFSLEMEKDEIIRGMVPYVVDVPNFAVNRAWSMNPTQHALMQDAQNAICDWDLRVHDGDMDIDQICWTMRRSVRKHKSQLVIVDHASLVGAPGFKNPRERINEVSGRLRAAIKHEDAAVLLLTQLRKVSREYSNTAPTPDDIKESGNLFEDCYACQILHRAYDPDTGKMSLDAQQNLCKIRGGGSTGATKGHFDPRRLCFEAQAEMGFEDYYQ